MDTGSIVAIILASIAIIPQIIGYVTQGKKDVKQLENERQSAAQQATIAAQTALASVIQPMQDALTRCQQRIRELEDQLVEKTNKIGELMQLNIDKDSEMAIMKYKMENIQMKLTDFINEKATSEGRTVKAKRPKEDTVPLEIKSLIKENEDKKTAIAEEARQMVEAIKSKSIDMGTGIGE